MKPTREALRGEIQVAASKLRWLQHQFEHGTCDDVGHDWKSIGGCNCGCFADSACSVPVMQCVRCGDCDYGDSQEAEEQRASCFVRNEYMAEEATRRALAEQEGRDDE